MERQPDIERARRLRHGPEYHAAKSEIMAPIDEFLRKFDARTGDEVVQLRRRGQHLNIVAITGLGTTVVLVLVSFILVARQRAPALFHVILARQLAGVGLVPRLPGADVVGVEQDPHDVPPDHDTMDSARLAYRSRTAPCTRRERWRTVIVGLPRGI